MAQDLVFIDLTIDEDQPAAPSKSSLESNSKHEAPASKASPKAISLQASGPSPILLPARFDEDDDCPAESPINRNPQSIFRGLIVLSQSKKRKRKDGYRDCDSSDEEMAKKGDPQDHLDDDVGISNTDAQEQTFISYLPPICNHPCLKMHPDELVETASLSSVPVPTVVNKLRLPAKTLIYGLLTSAQAEVCLRAVVQHEIRLPNGQRSGFFMGDGAGVGKGRQQAAIIFHNFLHGRCKALWLSVGADLIEDARRDIREIGGSGLVQCYNLKSFSVGQKLTLESGVLFCTYSLLVGGNGRQCRKDQIIQWCGREFDGVIALDECHRAKKLGTTKSGCSKAALAVQDLQDQLPLARVVYVSATGLAEPEDLACLPRLGLWGPDTAFSSTQAFISDIKRGGVGAMELCAMHMKAQGQYLARSLSFRGASFDVVREDLSADFVKLYDDCAVLWRKVVEAVYLIYSSDESSDARHVKAQIWGAHQRFWAQMCMAAKVPSTIKTAQHALRQGKCVVIGLQSTGESVAVGEDECDSEEPCSGADGIVRAFLTNHCLHLPHALRDSLLQELSSLKLPSNPLDEIIHRLGGPGKVAEMTGRKHRYVFANGMWKYVSRTKERGSTDAINVAERKLFQSGEKLVAIISEAASTGISLQADLRNRNRRRRVHITLQLPWSAEKAVQQMGRSHRSNQASAPEFKLILSPIGGEWRFASAVANRLQSLGALTQGDRRAAGASAAMRSFSIQPKYGLKALHALMEFILKSSHLKYAVPQFIRDSYESEEAFCAITSEAMKGVGIEGKTSGNGCRLKRFLNRIFGLPLQLQTHVFDLFFYLVCLMIEFFHFWLNRSNDFEQLGAEIAEAKAANKYSEGILDICGQTSLEEESDLYTCPRTGAVAKYYRVSTDRGVSWEQALTHLSQQSDKESGFYQATYQAASKSDLFVLALNKKEIFPVSSMSSKYYHLVRPNTGFLPLETHEIDLHRNYTKVSPATAKAFWERMYKFSETKCGHVTGKDCAGVSCTYKRRIHHYHIIAGLVLPFWKEIRSHNYNMKVVRVSIGGKRIVGVNVFPQSIAHVKALISKGIPQSRRIEQRLENIPQCAFLNPIGPALVKHDCLSMNGVDVIQIKKDSSWTPDLLIFARCFEIPILNQHDQIETFLQEVSWKDGPALYLNGQRVRFHLGKKAIAPLMLDQSLFCHQENELKILSGNNRFFVVVQVGRRRSISEAMAVVKARCPITVSNCQALLREVRRDRESDDVEIISEDSISLKCPLAFTRITDPCRGSSCRHLQCYDLGNFLSFAERSSRWECPVCDKYVRFEDLCIDSLSQLALQRNMDSDSFILNKDGMLVDDSASIGSTPVTVKKNQPRPLDRSPFRNLDLDDCCEPEMRSSHGGIPPEFTALSESGIWEYTELAESVFTYGPVSPADSDADSDAGEDDEEPSDLTAKLDEPVIRSPNGKMEVKACGSSRKMIGSAEMGPRSRPRRSQTVVRYADSSSDNHDEAGMDVETESD